MATNGQQCAHIWAQQTKQSGKGYGSVRFDGDTLYSYAEPIARIVERKGVKVCLMRDKSFSVTTSNHQSYARSAASHMAQFYVDDIGHPQSDMVRRGYEQKVKAMALSAARARKLGEFHANEARELAETANQCAAFFDWKWRLEVPTFSAEDIAAMRAKAAAKTKAERLAREERERADAIVMAGIVSEWLQNQRDSLPYQYHGDILLRVNDDRIQTTRGAQIPVSHARRIWPVILRCKASGVEYKRNGHTEHVGEFAIDSIAADGTIVAGCHTIKFDQVERIARELGLI